MTSEDKKMISSNVFSKVYLDNDGSVKFRSTHHPDQSISPEMVGSEILKSLKRAAEKHFDCPIRAAVVSVPADFDERQRRFTRLAAELAGTETFNALKLQHAMIDERTQSALRINY